jgi:hypothetical protein
MSDVKDFLINLSKHQDLKYVLYIISNRVDMKDSTLFELYPRGIKVKEAGGLHWMNKVMGKETIDGKSIMDTLVRGTFKTTHIIQLSSGHPSFYLALPDTSEELMDGLRFNQIWGSYISLMIDHQISIQAGLDAIKNENEQSLELSKLASGSASIADEYLQKRGKNMKELFGSQQGEMRPQTPQQPPSMNQNPPGG